MRVEAVNGSDHLAIVIAVWVCLTTVVANLILLALVVKLYTEYTKDRAQDRRTHA